METKRIAVIGAGIMGHGIAQVSAQAGFPTTLYDRDEKALEAGIRKIKAGLTTLVGKGAFPEEQLEEIMGRIAASRCMAEAVSKADVIIEAVVEKMTVKQELFSEIERLAPPHTLFASNTSSLSITEIASVLERPERFIGLHFFNPVPIMMGVEVVRGLETSDAAYETATAFLSRIGKETLLSKDFPGFIVNRMLPLMANEAFFLLWQGIGSAEDIDKSCTLMLHHPIGPLRLADYSGLDTLLSVLEYLHSEYGEKYRPCPLIRQLVKAGRLGRKTGKGVYTYPPES
ncbi:MAG: 3-hydroxybutyryl-CoA dehydrogenase [Proteobacteria bacterium]|nr:3-hydroxybutyryl-CoA dehydrogenase [Pseudomonadota bacterium]